MALPGTGTKSFRSGITAREALTELTGPLPPEVFAVRIDGQPGDRYENLSVRGHPRERAL